MLCCISENNRDKYYEKKNMVKPMPLNDFFSNMASDLLAVLLTATEKLYLATHVY